MMAYDTTTGIGGEIFLFLSLPLLTQRLVIGIETNTADVDDSR
jgi:hypothetical protein